LTEELAAGKLLVDEPAEAVARIQIRNPEKRNALDHDILDGLAELLPRLDRGIDVRCVIITGSEGHFSAGYDIGSISEESLEADARALVAHPRRHRGAGRASLADRCRDQRRLPGRRPGARDHLRPAHLHR
jgi:enoyl-CoA hydratase/carnithine racemase